MKENKAMRELKYQINYLNLLATISNFPDILGGSKSLFQEVAKRG